MPVWCLVRDRDSGFVLLVMVTAARLLEAHPRLDARAFEDRAAAEAALAALGTPPVAEAW